ncbi:peptidylprolyl isomerase [Candidatus Albibeggiatoa sp. nov. NOAA]|uniref:peptidylprolyl isomerase n=1 Tax=Candidatus Albibeggiatoa sp. nov. NOAA TaxID=3162724 RepID=UPI0032FE76D8|nr:peptidylprolyl isomerase [Thiotrichaceae bacterium]
MNFKLASCVFSCSLLLAGQSYAAPEDPIVIVNGEVVTEQDYENYKTMREEQQRQGEPEPTQQDLIEELIKRELVVQDAEKQGLDKTPNFIARYESIRGNLLANVATQAYLDKNTFTEAQLKQRYEDEMAKLTLPNEFKTRHILLEDEAAAKSMIAQLDEGNDFSELAKAHSIDSGSSEEGGDIGWVRVGQVVEKFAAALEGIEKGTYSKTPVNTEFGWHVIMVDDKRALQAPPFDALKDRIAALVKEEQIIEYLTGLREAAKVEIKTAAAEEAPAEQTAAETVAVESAEQPATEAAPAESAEQPATEAAPVESAEAEQAAESTEQSATEATPAK